MADFLETLTSMFGSGNNAGNLFNVLTSWATGGFKGRPQWRDLEFMNDVQNRLWPDEIARQGDFLEGIAPSQGRAMETLSPYQANAYNTYQDATYGADTQRQTDRIKTMASQLGMSPWEITGAGGATPLPSPGPSAPPPSRGENNMPAFLSGITPLATAKLQAQTALATTKMQTDTQRYVADQQTQGGKLPQAQIEQAAAAAQQAKALTEQTGAQTNLIWTQAQAAESDMALRTIETFARYAGTTTVSIPGYTSTTTNQLKDLAQLYQQLTDTAPLADRQEALKGLIKKMPADQWAKINRDIDRVSSMIAKGTQDFVTGAANNVHAFLDGIVGNNDHKH